MLNYLVYEIIDGNETEIAIFFMKKDAEVFVSIMQEKFPSIKYEIRSVL